MYSALDIAKYVIGYCDYKRYDVSNLNNKSLSKLDISCIIKQKDSHIYMRNYI